MISLFCIGFNYFFFCNLEKAEEKTKRVAKKQKKAPEEAPRGYVHVRARRGEATDSHSLAERVINHETSKCRKNSSITA